MSVPDCSTNHTINFTQSLYSIQFSYIYSVSFLIYLLSYMLLMLLLVVLSWSCMCYMLYTCICMYIAPGTKQIPTKSKLNWLLRNSYSEILTNASGSDNGFTLWYTTHLSVFHHTHITTPKNQNTLVYSGIQSNGFLTDYCLFLAYIQRNSRSSCDTKPEPNRRDSIHKCL